MGRKPTPTYLKLLRGNPGKRAINANEPKPEIPAKQPAPPVFLDDYALEEWKRVAPELWRMGLLTRVDVATLAAYCMSYAQWRTAVESLRRMSDADPVMHGLMVKTAGGAAANPLVWIISSAGKAMVKFAAEFGMTPASRVGISAGEDPRPRKFGNLLADFSNQDRDWA